MTDTDTVTEGPAEPFTRLPLHRLLIGVLAVAILTLAAAGGYLIGQGQGAPATPAADSVDAGFAWDMTSHHLQAVEIAGYTRDHTSDSLVKTLAFDIETSQFNQVGQMRGWLDAWGLPVASPNPVMSWMAGSGHIHLASTGLMPGLATPAQVTKLERLTGKPLDVYFLQLILRHHQGGLPMARWAAGHANLAYVRNSAQKMADSQSGEIIIAEQMLRARGASPLPPPD